MRLPAALTSALFLALSASSPALAATTHEVAVEDNLFAPRVVSGKVGDSVLWSTPSLIGNPHNIREDGRIFRSGEPTPLPIEFTATFSAGRFHYFCEVHGSQAGGMDGVVKMKPTIARKPAGLPFTVRWASMATDTGSTFDVQYRVGSGSWKSWKKNVDGFKAVFGKGGKPVSLMNGTTYSFRARSQEGEAQSFWSPKRAFRA